LKNYLRIIINAKIKDIAHDENININSNINLNKRNIEYFYNNVYSKNYFSPPKYRNIDNKKCIASISSDVPFSFTQAIKSPDRKEWIDAINEELNNLYNNNIMTLAHFVLHDKTLISTKWIFSNKRDSNNCIIKRKACLVARWF